ncbi:MAG: DUF4249 family protein [Bacteroidota bacterium]
MVTEVDIPFETSDHLVVFCLLNPSNDTTFCVIDKTLSTESDHAFDSDSLNIISAVIYNRNKDSLCLSPCPDYTGRYFAPSSGFFVEGETYLLNIHTLEFGEAYAETSIPFHSDISVNLNIAKDPTSEGGYTIMAKWPVKFTPVVTELRILYYRNEDQTDSTLWTIYKPNSELYEENDNVVFRYKGYAGVFNSIRLISADPVLSKYFDQVELMKLRQSEYASFTIINPSGVIPDAGNITGGVGVFGSYIYNNLTISKFE